MNKIYFIMIMLLLGPFFLFISEQHAEELPLNDSFVLSTQEKLLRPFFNALKSGNIRLIKKYLSEEAFSSYKRLLENNQEYPEYLRKYYENFTFVIDKNPSKTKDGIIFHVTMKGQNGGDRSLELKVDKAGKKISF